MILPCGEPYDFRVHRLVNTVQRYAWGSATAIQEFLGQAADGEPAAEMWMGTHPVAPSRVQRDAGSEIELSEAIGAELPYLFKVLAAARPLSLQVHPTAQMAADGFAAEETAGIGLTDPRRNFKDPNPKPEMAYALTRLESLVGFRPTATLLEVLRAVGTPLTDRLFHALEGNPGYAGIVALLSDLLDSEGGPTADDIDVVVGACADRLRAGAGADPDRAYSTVVELARSCPGDVGVVASLLLNRMTFEPGEAAFLAPGMLHAHLSGMCLEIMSCSDNVLRAGLTNKHRDRPALLRCLVEGMSDAQYVDPLAIDGHSQVFAPPVTEFALSITHSASGAVTLPASGRRIVLCIEGEVALSTGGDRLTLAKGESLYADDADGPLSVTGNGVVAQAYEPL